MSENKCGKHMIISPGVMETDISKQKPSEPRTQSDQCCALRNQCSAHRRRESGGIWKKIPICVCHEINPVHGALENTRLMRRKRRRDR